MVRASPSEPNTVRASNARRARDPFDLLQRAELTVRLRVERRPGLIKRQDPQRSEPFPDGRKSLAGNTNDMHCCRIVDTKLAQRILLS